MTSVELPPLLKKDNVLIKDPEAVKAKIDKMRQQGVDNLQIIADFDRTMTRHRRPDGTPAFSCHRALETCSKLPEEYQTKTRALFEHYYPIETDPDMDRETKTKYMVEWWTKANNLMLEYGLTKDHVQSCASSPGIMLRDGVETLLRRAQETKVPVHIFSAGLYDVIHAHLRIKDLEKYGAHVASNVMEFDEDGKLLGFKGKLIHTLSKNGACLEGSPNWDEVTSRSNVLLLGDNPGDLDMDKGLNVQTELAIGFLNDRVEDRKQDYMDLFDIVLLEDPDMSCVNSVLESLLA